MEWWVSHGSEYDGRVGDAAPWLLLASVPIAIFVAFQLRRMYREHRGQRRR